MLIATQLRPPIRILRHSRIFGGRHIASVAVSGVLEQPFGNWKRALALQSGSKYRRWETDFSGDASFVALMATALQLVLIENGQRGGLDYFAVPLRVVILREDEALDPVIIALYQLIDELVAERAIGVFAAGNLPASVCRGGDLAHWSFRNALFTSPDLSATHLFQPLAQLGELSGC